MSRSEDVGRKLYAMLFPGSACRDTAEINLDAFLQSHRDRLDMRVPADQTALLEVASEGGARCTYGSYLEDRTRLWAGLYPMNGANNRLVHLGVDINNVRVGQAVASLTDGVVFHVLNDVSDRTGWGGRVLVRSTSGRAPKGFVYLMYAHLDHRLPAVGSPIRRGDILGYVGGPTVNGGWFPHLHLQIMSDKYLRSYAHNLNDIDGYAVSPASLSHPKIKAALKRDGLIDPLVFVSHL